MLALPLAVLQDGKDLLTERLEGAFTHLWGRQFRYAQVLAKLRHGIRQHFGLVQPAPDTAPTCC